MLTNNKNMRAKTLMRIISKNQNMSLSVPRPVDSQWQQVSLVQLVWLISNKTFREVYPQSSVLLTCHWAEKEEEGKKTKTDVFNVQASSCSLSLLQLWQSEVENWSSCDTPRHHSTMCGWRRTSHQNPRGRFQTWFAFRAALLHIRGGYTGFI